MKRLCYLAVLMMSAFAAHGDNDRREATKFTATLVSTEETPANFEAGTAQFSAEIVAHDTQINFTLTYENTTSNPLVAHVHFGQRNVAGGVSYFLCGGGGKPACPANTSGTVTGSVVAADVVGPTAQGIAVGNLAGIIAMMRAGLTYANIHTTAHPAGESAVSSGPSNGTTTPTTTTTTDRRLDRASASAGIPWEAASSTDSSFESRSRFPSCV